MTATLISAHLPNLPLDKYRGAVVEVCFNCNPHFHLLIPLTRTYNYLQPSRYLQVKQSRVQLISHMSATSRTFRAFWFIAVI